jgi:hypothetical protein
MDRKNVEIEASTSPTFTGKASLTEIHLPRYVTGIDLVDLLKH